MKDGGVGGSLKRQRDMGDRDKGGSRAGERQERDLEQGAAETGRQERGDTHNRNGPRCLGGLLPELREL